MNKIIAIAPDYQHLRNYCKDKDIPIDRFIHATDIKKMRGLRNYSYIFIDTPRDKKFWDELQIELRKGRANRLPLDINQWPLTEFV